MSRAARIDSFQPGRLSSGATRMLGIFALGVVAGVVLGLSIWSSRNLQAMLSVDRDAFGVPVATEPSSLAQPQPGRYAVDVLRVIDGDTFEARVHIWPGQELTIRVRLPGIDAPELKARCDVERIKAEAASTALRNLLADSDISIWNVGPDKYFGRVVAEVGTRRTPDVSAALLAKGVARTYAGGHREGWCDMAAGG